jgi:hypothetical protein
MNGSSFKSKKINQLIWLGTGDIAKDNGLINSQSTIHLVDANEAIIERLHKRFKNHQNVNIHAALIAHHDKPVDFNHYSLQEFNGIAKPTGLKQRYPGLKQIESTNKQATAITDFIASIKVAPNESNTIIFDLPGQSASLIQALISNQALHLFNELVVLSNQEQLFQDELPTSELVNLLEQNGFLCQTHPSSYQDYTIIQAQLNPLYKQLTALNAQNAEQEKQLANAQTEIKNKQDLLTKAQKETAALVQEKQAASQQLAEALKQLEQIKSQQSSDIAQANKQIEAQASQLTALNAQNVALEKSNITLAQIKTEQEANLSEAKESIDKLQQQVEQLTQAHNHEQKSKDEEKTKNIELSKSNDQQQAHIQQLQQQLDDINARYQKLQEQENAEQVALSETKRENEAQASQIVVINEQTATLSKLLEQKQTELDQLRMVNAELNLEMSIKKIIDF